MHAEIIKTAGILCRYCFCSVAWVINIDLGSMVQVIRSQLYLAEDAGFLSVTLPLKQNIAGSAALPQHCTEANLCVWTALSYY